MAVSDFPLTLTISTPTPLARRDSTTAGITHTTHQFLLPRLLRGATLLRSMVVFLRSFLLPRLLRGATKKQKIFLIQKRISTPTPLARRDDNPNDPLMLFIISTPTPLARRDLMFRLDGDFMKNFYSHASCEARHQQGLNRFWSKISTPTPLARRDQLQC